MPRFLFAVSILVMFTGCTAPTLSRQTVKQADTYMDIHYRMVMENLAMTAHDPCVLPAYSVMYYGTTAITDSVGLSANASFARFSYPSWGIDPNASRTINDNWTQDPVQIPEKLRALRLAFRYAVCGNRYLGFDRDVTLATYTPPCQDGVCQDIKPRYYFAVDKLMGQMPDGWLHMGGPKDAPKCAPYSATCCDKCVWVCDEDVEGLSLLTLACQTISTANVISLQRPKVELATFNGTKLLDTVYVNCKPLAIGQDASKMFLSASVTAYVDECGRIVKVRDRNEGNTGSDGKLKSALSASGIKTP